MDLRYTSDEQRFREEVRANLESEVPRALREKVRKGAPLEKEDFVIAHRILNRLGYAVPHWPVQWGGRDWTPVQRSIVAEEIQRACVPAPLSANVSMIGPVLAAFGSPAQKERFLPRIASLDDWWCQGFSEPNSGSDLASLKMSARRTDDGYVINGQKIWTTYAQHADWIFALVRTDLQAKPQRGISFVLIDMRSQGITLRPIELIDGDCEVNEVFFEDVEVPLENLVGAENHGWDYAKYLLTHERTGIAGIGVAKEMLERVKAYARTTIHGGTSLWSDENFRLTVAEVEVELSALEVTQLRVGTSTRGDAAIDSAASLLKVKGSEIQQRATELLLEVAGPDAWLRPTESTEDWQAYSTGLYLNWRKLSIYGGSNEIQKNIVAKSVFGD